MKRSVSGLALKATVVCAVASAPLKVRNIKGREGPSRKPESTVALQ